MTLSPPKIWIPSLRPLVDPVFETLRSPDRPTSGGRVDWVSGQLARPFMGWQRLVADVGKEMVPADEQTIEVLRFQGFDVNGSLMMPAYREVIVTVMRQCGKTTLVLGVECDTLWTPNSRAAYTAQ